MVKRRFWFTYSVTGSKGSGNYGNWAQFNMSPYELLSCEAIENVRILFKDQLKEKFGTDLQLCLIFFSEISIEDPIYKPTPV